MAELTEQNDLQVVYLYDTKKPTHPLTGSTKLAKGVALQPGQTTIAPIDGKENFFNGQGWTDKLVIAYEFDTDNNNQYTDPVMIPEGQVLAANQTFVKPKDGLYWPIRFNGTEWIGITKEEWEAAHPAPKMEPSASQIAQANTLKDVAQLQVAHTSQQKLNADLMKDNASLKKQNQTQLTVNATLMKQVAVLQQQIKALTPATTTAQ